MKKPNFRKVKEKLEKVKDLDLTSIKDKLENVKLKKSKLEKLKEKLEDFDQAKKRSSHLEEVFIETTEDSHIDTGIQSKYKSFSLLGKTKNMLKEYECLEDSYLPKSELQGLQHELSEMIHSVNQESSKSEVKWETITTSKTKSDFFRKDEKSTGCWIIDYWLYQFKTVLKHYMDKYSEDRLEVYILSLSNGRSNKYPLLRRIFNILKAIPPVEIIENEKIIKAF